MFLENPTQRIKFYYRIINVKDWVLFKTVKLVNKSTKFIIAYNNMKMNNILYPIYNNTKVVLIWITRNCLSYLLQNTINIILKRIGYHVILFVPWYLKWIVLLIILF